jgi:ABC-2 type transport system ATP-binding protein
VAAPHLTEITNWAVDLIGVRKTYDRKVQALRGVNVQVGRGEIFGLLGPNGAGKTSLMRILVGMLKPASGSVRVLGEIPWNNPRFNVRIGYCPEHDGFYEWLAGRAFLEWLLMIRGFPHAQARTLAAAALERVRLVDAAGRAVGTYSRGMRQRLKLAQAIAHRSELLVLDEPLTGTDPLVRQELIGLIKSFAAEGRHVIVSSHVLHEIEALTTNIVVIHRGRLVAFGDRREIRALIDRHPHTVSIRASRARELAAELAREESVAEIAFPDGRLLVRTREPDAFYSRLPAIATKLDCAIEELTSPDDNLEAVFRYLTER